MSLTVSPAYGRDYKSRNAVLEDWHNNKDFVVESFGPHMGRYINKADAEANLVGPVEIRYAKLTKAVIV